MADDALTTGELGRMVGAMRSEFQTGLAGLNARLDRVVSTDVYTLQAQHTDQRLTDLAREVQATRDDYRKLEEAFDAYKLSEAARRERERQARLYQAIVPILIALLSAAVAIWAVTAS